MSRYIPIKQVENCVLIGDLKSNKYGIKSIYWIDDNKEQIEGVAVNNNLLIIIFVDGGTGKYSLSDTERLEYKKYCNNIKTIKNRLKIAFNAKVIIDDLGYINYYKVKPSLDCINVVNHKCIKGISDRAIQVYNIKTDVIINYNIEQCSSLAFNIHNNSACIKLHYKGCNKDVLKALLESLMDISYTQRHTLVVYDIQDVETILMLWKYTMIDIEFSDDCFKNFVFDGNTTDKLFGNSSDICLNNDSYIIVSVNSDGCMWNAGLSTNKFLTHIKQVKSNYTKVADALLNSEFKYDFINRLIVKLSS